MATLDCRPCDADENYAQALVESLARPLDCGSELQGFDAQSRRRIMRDGAREPDRLGPA